MKLALLALEFRRDYWCEAFELLERLEATDGGLLRPVIGLSSKSTTGIDGITNSFGRELSKCFPLLGSANSILGLTPDIRLTVTGLRKW